MAEYGWSLARILYHTPVTVLFALLPAITHRHGGEEGPGHADHAAARARRHREAQLRRDFRIIPNPAPTP